MREEESAARQICNKIALFIIRAAAMIMSDTQLKIPAIRKPKPIKRANRKLLMFLLVFFITILAILFFQSSISKISFIEIEGNEFVATETIELAAGIAAGDQFFGISSRTIGTRVETLPTVQSAEVTKRFPGLVRIRVTEYSRVAFQITPGGDAVILFADGSKMVSQNGFVLDKPILSGWIEDDPLMVKLCGVLSQIPDRLLSDVSEISPDPTSAYPDKIKIYTRSNFEVYTTVSYFPEKIQYLDLYVAQLYQNDIKTGIITLLESDQHAPFPKSEDILNTKESESKPSANN